MEKIAFAGSFDPITLGHMWVIKQASLIAKNVVIFVAHNPVKSSLFSVEEKLAMVNAAVAEASVDAAGVHAAGLRGSHDRASLLASQAID